MKDKYQRYIDYIVSDLQPPYFENMRDVYGLKDSEYEMVLNKVFNQTVTTKGRWEKFVYDSNDNEIYWEDSNSNWVKQEYDGQGNIIYWENNTGHIEDNRYE
jgi:hypothetical protein